MDLINFWLNDCYAPERAEEILYEHGISYNGRLLGEVKIIYGSPSGCYIEPSSEGVEMIAVPVWYEIPCLLSPVDDPCLFDIIAFNPQEPKKWYFLRKEYGLILGERNLFNASINNDPLVVHRTPLDWLANGCQGIVLLSQSSISRLQGTHKITGPDTGFLHKIIKNLRSRKLQDIPLVI